MRLYSQPLARLEGMELRTAAFQPSRSDMPAFYGAVVFPENAPSKPLTAYATNPNHYSLLSQSYRNAVKSFISKQF